MSNKGYNININTSKMGGVLITTKQGNRALVLPLDGETVREYEGVGYISAAVWTNEEADQYGNHLAVQAKISKEKRDAGQKAPYIGNGKLMQPAAAPAYSEPSSIEKEELPF